MAIETTSRSVMTLTSDYLAGTALRACKGLGVCLRWELKVYEDGGQVQCSIHATYCKQDGSEATTNVAI